jgi:alkaline phosphatase D
MKKTFSLIVLAIALFGQVTYSQTGKLVAGPMLGHVDFREANIWMATQMPGKLTIEFWKEDATEHQTQSVVVADDIYRSAVANLAFLEPGTRYHYQIKTQDKKKLFVYPSFDSSYVFTTETLWQYRTDPPTFRFALGSCAFINDSIYDRPGKPYGKNYTIFNEIRKQQPDMMLWMGDNIYLREVDFESRQGINYRYLHARKIPSLAALLHTCPQYAIWDDHDYGPNDANGSYVHKDWTLEAFKRFWANPSYGGPATGDGITTHFAMNDVEFFMLDNRYHRTPENAFGVKPTILGEQQIQWLITALKTSKATYKFVVMGGQFLNTAAKFENYSVYPEERQLLLDAIEKNNIKGVIFLTGDRHCTELSELTLSNGLKVYDLTVSPLTSGAYDNSKEENAQRVDGTIVAEQNFGIIALEGPVKERKLTISIFKSTGEKAWEKTITLN